jgi:hypothetical protein
MNAWIWGGCLLKYTRGDVLFLFLYILQLKEFQGRSLGVSHFVKSFLLSFNAKFRGRWIGKADSLLCPARSPDLTPLNLMLWGL